MHRLRQDLEVVAVGARVHYGIFRFGVVQVEPAFRPASRRISTKTGAAAVIL